MQSLLSSAEADLARAIDASGGPIRRMRQKISKPKQTIRCLSTKIDVDALSSFSSDEADGACEDDYECEKGSDEEQEAVTLTRRRSKLGSWKKKPGMLRPMPR